MKHHSRYQCVHCGAHHEFVDEFRGIVFRCEPCPSCGSTAGFNRDDKVLEVNRANSIEWPEWVSDSALTKLRQTWAGAGRCAVISGSKVEFRIKGVPVSSYYAARNEEATYWISKDVSATRRADILDGLFRVKHPVEDKKTFIEVIRGL